MLYKPLSMLMFSLAQKIGWKEEIFGSSVGGIKYFLVLSFYLDLCNYT